MIIQVNDVAVTINGKKIFSKVSFDLQNGEMVALTGQSGCGKTTLLNCLGLIQTVNSGKILVDGKDTTNWTDKQKTKFWHHYATFIYQDYGIIEEESVAYNITLNKTRMRNENVKSILERVGLAGREHDLAMVLSGGEKQRVGIARAILKNAAVVFADEPTASLDAKNREIVISLLRQCAKQGAIVVIATHDEQLVRECDRIVDM